MTRANKLGTSSAVAFALTLGFARFDLAVVVGAFFAVMLGILAAVNGSKWWLGIPLVTAVLVGFAMWAGFTAS
jgi:hypothetical protein